MDTTESSEPILSPEEPTMPQRSTVSEAEMKQLVLAYFKQLTQGCGNGSCTQPRGRCATVDGPISSNSAFAHGLTLARSLGWSGICERRSVNQDPGAAGSMELDDAHASSDGACSPTPMDTNVDRCDEPAAFNSHADPSIDSSTVTEDAGCSAGANGDAAPMQVVNTDDQVPDNAAAVNNSQGDKGSGKTHHATKDSSDIAGTDIQASDGKTESTTSSSLGPDFDEYFTSGIFTPAPDRKMASFIFETFGPSGFEGALGKLLRMDTATLSLESDHDVDLTRLRALYHLLCKTTLAMDDSREKMAVAINSLVTNEMRRAQATTFYDAKKLRIFLVLFECPLLEDPDTHETLLPALCQCVRGLTTEQRAVLARWWSQGSETVALLRRKVRALQQFLTLRVLERMDEGDAYVINHDVAVGSAVEVLKTLHTANDMRRKRVVGQTQPNGVDLDALTLYASADDTAEEFLSPGEFQNDGVNENLKVIRDFEVWKFDKFVELDIEPDVPENAITFCHYDFILTLPMKAKILTFEHRFMHDVEHRAHVHRNMLQVLLGGASAHFVINVRRDHLVRDALREISGHLFQDPDVIRQPLRVNFVGEEGLDYGGVKKEFFQLIIKELFDPIYGMFHYFEDTRYHWFARHSLEAPDEYNLLGLVLGLAVYNNTILDLHFPRAVYKKLRDERVGLADLYQFNPDLARGLRQLLDYDGDDVEDVFSVNFCVEYEQYGETKVDDLCENGRNLAVTAANKKDYVKLYVDYTLNTSISRVFDAFKEGFLSTTQGSEALKLFNANDLELLICGTQDLDFTVLKKICKYDGFDAGKDTPVVKWFWELMETFTDKEKEKLLSFSTGSDRVPVGGLAKFNFSICKQGLDSDQLPTSHTCFNVLMLPEYSSKEKLDRLLRLAIENSEGFGMI